MTKVINSRGEFYIPDELANNPDATQAELQEAAQPWALYEQGLLNEKMHGGLFIASNAFMALFDELCVQLGLDITESMEVGFFVKYDSIFKGLYLSELMPSELVAINKEALEQAYNTTD